MCDKKGLVVYFPYIYIYFTHIYNYIHIYTESKDKTQKEFSSKSENTSFTY